MAPAPPRRRVLLPALLGLLLLMAPFAHEGRILADDAFISMRYAENLAGGRGLVFNPGERVEGYSNLLLVLLLALLRLLGIPTIPGVQLLLAAAAATLLATLPALSERMGGGRIPGALAAAAFALTAPFQTWALAGLETSLYTALLLLGLAGACAAEGEGQGRPGPRALIPFALLGITRPEGVIVIAAVAASVALSRGLRAGMRFGALTSLWGLQLLFRLAYYGERVPNTYHAKVWEGADRWSSGFGYLRLCATEAGMPLALLLAAGALACLRRIADARVRHLLAATAALLFFAVASGGDGFPDGRFVFPALPLLLVLAPASLGGAAGSGAALALLAVVIASPTSAAPRRTLALVARAATGEAPSRAWLRQRVACLTRPQETAQQRTGSWLRAHLPAGSLIAVNDCGQIPWASGHPTLDTVGLMDRHIARVPGRRHEKVDLPYVLNRRPAAIVLRFGKLGAGLPYDTRMASHPAFLVRYRLEHVQAEGATGYYVFLRDPAAELAEIPGAVDLVALLPRADRFVLEPAGARPASPGEIRPGLRYVALPGERLAEIDALRPGGEEAAPPERVRALDAALRELGPLTHHGIVVSLPAGTMRAGLDFDLAGAAAAGGVLRVSVGFAPWLWMQGLSHEAARLEAKASAEKGFVASRSLLTDPSRRPEDRGFAELAVELPPGPPRLRIHLDVERAGPPDAAGDPFEVMLADPRVEPAGPSGG